jgi:hypothetical protein
MFMAASRWLSWLEYRFCSDYQVSCVNHGHILSHEKVWFACNLDEIVILGLSTHKIVASP